MRDTHALSAGRFERLSFEYDEDVDGFRIEQDSVKRTAVGIWNCSACRKTIAGGAWSVSTTTAATVRRYVLLHSVWIFV